MRERERERGIGKRIIRITLLARWPLSLLKQLSLSEWKRGREMGGGERRTRREGKKACPPIVSWKVRWSDCFPVNHNTDTQCTGKGEREKVFSRCPVYTYAFMRERERESNIGSVSWRSSCPFYFFFFSLSPAISLLLLPPPPTRRQAAHRKRERESDKCYIAQVEAAWARSTYEQVQEARRTSVYLQKEWIHRAFSLWARKSAPICRVEEEEEEESKVSQLHSHSQWPREWHSQPVYLSKSICGVTFLTGN